MSTPFDLQAAFAADPLRVQHFSQTVQLEHQQIHVDLSKNWIDKKIEFDLIRRAAKAGLEAKRDAMFAGETVNASENRAVGHVRLRDPHDATVTPVRDAFLAYAEQIRSDDGITDIVNIGIGGSDLGPAFAVRALDAHVNHGKRYHFVANVDGHELALVLRQLQPDRTLFIVASKTFTTFETLRNAHSAKAWFLAHTKAPLSGHFCAVTNNEEAAAAFGITQHFPIWDWVGGRFSVCSAIGLSLAIAIGEAGFRAFLAGARAMDVHFKHTPLAQNLPVRMALLDVHYRNDRRIASRCLVPYSAALGRLPAYVQQLEMESNGKSVDAQGAPVTSATAPVIWGEAGTNGQHAFFQMLHQGSDVIPVEFVAVKTPDHDTHHHRALLASALAQAQALMLGRPHPQGHKHFPGNRPSTFLLLDALTPESLGGLIALYEHRVFCSGAIWGINSFDQFGVELGKTLTDDLLLRLSSRDITGLDASTAGLLAKL